MGTGLRGQSDLGRLERSVEGGSLRFGDLIRRVRSYVALSKPLEPVHCDNPVWQEVVILVDVEVAVSVGDTHAVILVEVESEDDEVAISLYNLTLAHMPLDVV